MNGPTEWQRVERHEPDKLDDVIDEYVAASSQPSYETLVEWVRRYPQYKDELTDFTAQWSVAEQAPVYDIAPESAEAQRLVSRHMDIVRRVMAMRAVGEASIKGIIAEGQAQGVSMRQLAEAAGLSVPLVTKLDRRLVRYSSIPGEIISSLAAAIGREVEVVARYLQGGALLAPGANYKADQAPSLPEQHSFAEEVRRDRGLSPEQRQRLLDMSAGE